ncbi:hypothetical protein G647_03221 [Cladophialophora carrionii CBS 160.54]|uniref:Protein kinase domain-containing protein n=1 Tax=Cladophialophora carrionii CBS 160.54 TaxID=1279043 RepID=V9DHS4_9EURO|nr:uncharacterized protein G647_03221 [Cladophialophora carrionii CBS 160.54]ETI26444.1 hypothetical protein G647_03221 [Cladophialophora carrionii CBS 160.54]
MPFVRLARSKFARMCSTLTGRSGRVYTRDRILQAHPHKPELNIYLAHCEDRAFLLKPVSQSILELSKELKDEFGDSPRLRTRLDDNEAERVLLYDYYKDNLLSLVKNRPDLPLGARKSILRNLGLGLKDLHSRNWIHLDTKPDNAMIDWNVDENGRFIVERVAWADLDCALQLMGEQLLDHRIGNVMWRSPEGQTGKGIGKPSEVFSFGLICLYTITGVEALHPDFEQLKKDGVEPEQLILYQLLSMFGPAPPGLIAHVNDEYWGELSRVLSDVVAGEDPSIRFEQWDEGILPNLNAQAKRVILKMTELDPIKRPTMSCILGDPRWEET